MNLKEIVGINLKYYRYKAGKSQEKYYVEHGLSPKYCAGIERGSENITIETIEDIARSLGITSNDLVVYNEAHIIYKNRIDQKEKI